VNYARIDFHLEKNLDNDFIQLEFENNYRMTDQ